MSTFMHASFLSYDSSPPVGRKYNQFLNFIYQFYIYFSRYKSTILTLERTFGCNFLNNIKFCFYYTQLYKHVEDKDI